MICKQIYIIYFWIIISFLLIGCQQTEDKSQYEMIEMPVTLYVQADTRLLSRAPGDPGMEGYLNLPTKLYLFVSSPEETIIYHAYSLNENQWTLEQYISNTTALYRATLPIAIPRYTGIIDKGRVYAVLSIDELSQFQSFVSNNLCESSFSLDNLKSLQFNAFDDTNSNVNLRDVYAGCNYVYNYINRPSATVICTHIASKVDIRWNLRDILNSYPDATMRNLTLDNIPQYGYFFNDTLSNNAIVGRTLNSSTNGKNLFATGNSLSDILNPGSSIYGRHDFYMFHPLDNKIQWSVYVDNGEESNLTYKISQYSTPDNFDKEEVPYVRIDINVDGVNSGVVITP